MDRNYLKMQAVVLLFVLLRLDLDFQSWTERMQTPEYAITTIRNLQTKASELVQRYYQIKADGSFSSEVAYIVLSK